MTKREKRRPFLLLFGLAVIVVVAVTANVTFEDGVVMSDEEYSRQAQALVMENKSSFGQEKTGIVEFFCLGKSRSN